MKSRKDSCPCWGAPKETLQGLSRWDPRVAYRLPGRVVLLSDRYVVAATGPLPQFDLDTSRPRESAPPTHPDTKRLALPVAAVVPASVVRPEPAVVRQIGPPERKLLAHWLTKRNKKVKTTNSVLTIS